jgi:DUF4097 and DUF4098 domain-containing protein YvlB
MTSSDNIADAPAAHGATKGNERHERFVVHGPLHATIRTASGDVKVTNSDDTSCHVRAVSRGSHASERLGQAEISFDEATNALRVITRPKSLRSRFFDFHDIDLFITVPANSTMTVHTASGDLDLRGTYADVDVASASGDVNAGVVLGQLNVNVASGDVEAREVHGTTNVKAASGDVTIDAAHGDVKIHAVSGDIALGAVAPLNTRVHSVSGDLLVKVQRGLVVEVNAKTVSGSLRSDIDLDASAPASSEGDGVVVIDASTISGDVRIARS